MKRLISQEEVLNKKNEKEIYIDDNTIITAAAKDLAKDLGIEFKKCDCKNQKNDIEEKKKAKTINNHQQSYQKIKFIRY